MRKYILLIVSLFLGVISGQAQYSDLLNFNGTSSSYGGDPECTLTPSVTGDSLFGIANKGGANNQGCVFMYTKTGAYKDILDFNGNNTPYGTWPLGSLTLSGNLLYGVTEYGGTNNGGVIFLVKTDGSGYKDVFNFTGGGMQYNGSLLLLGNKLYGPSGQGGNGCIFSVDTNGSNYRNVVNFTGTSGLYPGEGPVGSLVFSNGVFYGMTNDSGPTTDGVVFSVDTNGTNYKVLVNFTGLTGSYQGLQPFGSLMLSGTKLYGMTGELGSPDGNLFSVDTRGNNYKVLVSFTGTSGSYPGKLPEGAVVLSGEILYGMTASGGANGAGVLFSVDTDGTNYTDLHDFTSNTGTEPMAIALTPSITGDTLYGTTAGGGTNNDGVIFGYSLHTDETGVDNINSSLASVNIYPDPNNGHFTISGLTSGQLVEIYNYMGQRVSTQLASEKIMDVDISTLANGIYLVRIQDNNGTVFAEKKMVKTD